MKRYLSVALCASLLNILSVDSKTLQQMQNLYKNIGDDLMSIRKEFISAQPKIYLVLDRVDKMYNLAKVSAEKKHKLKENLKNKSAETKKLSDEINTLKEKLISVKTEYVKVNKKLEDTNKELQLEKAQAAQLVQEKSKLVKEQDNLELQLSKIKSAKKKKTSSNDLIHEIKDLKNLSDEEKAILKRAQSLSLSSTSAPSSPR